MNIVIDNYKLQLQVKDRHIHILLQALLNFSDI